jgi:hypothetical protein
MGPTQNLALVTAKKAPLQSKVMDHLARSLLASMLLTRGEARRGDRRRPAWRHGKLLIKLRISPQIKKNKNKNKIKN